MKPWVPLGLLAAAVLHLACAATTQSRALPDRDRITAEEIEAANARTAMDVIRRLRPFWVRPGGTRGASYPVVYADNVRLGGLEHLDNVFVEDIEEIRFLSASDATTFFGTGHDAGVIQLILRR